MTPKEKAQDLIKKFEDENYFDEESIRNNAIVNAIICTDEVIYVLEHLGGLNDIHLKFSVKHWGWIKDELSLLADR